MSHSKPAFQQMTPKKVILRFQLPTQLVQERSIHKIQIPKAKPTNFLVFVNDTSTDRMQLLLIIGVTPNKRPLTLMDFVNTSFRHRNKHHSIRRESLNNFLSQSGPTSKGKLTTFLMRKLGLNFLNEIMKVFKFRTLSR